MKITKQHMQKLIDNSKEELKELEDLVEPKSIWGKLRNYGRHPGITQIMILNIRIKYIEQELKIFEEYEPNPKNNNLL